MSSFDFDRLFGGRYIKADDIPEEGSLILTIADFSVEEIGPNKDEKCLLEFNETEKRLVLNVTNGKALASLYGKDANGWIGKRVRLVQAVVDFAGKSTMGVRISPKAIRPVQEPPPPPEPEFEDADY
jgi:hypothetical protein